MDRGSLARFVLCVLTLTCFALSDFADSFGRYGYNALPQLPDLKFGLNGFSANADKASSIDFIAPITRLVPQSTHSTALECSAEGPDGIPRIVRTSLVGNSLDLYFDNGLAFDCESASAPFLSWTDGTVGPNVPTPDVKWVLMSFTTPEPPFILGFCGSKASLTVTGVKGKWRVSCPTFSGWVRIWLPFGISPQVGNDAATLGAMTEKVLPFSWLWETNTPTVTKVFVTGDDLGVDADWKFDGPGAFVPQAPILAQIGGNPLTIESPYDQLPGTGSSGPFDPIKGTDLVIHFPCRRIPSGRAVGIGPVGNTAYAADSTDTPASLSQLACDLLRSDSSDQLFRYAEQKVTRFLISANYTLEPGTKQQLPYSDAGDGLELAAANSFLTQASMVATGSNQANALFDSILWKRDWWSWLVLAKDPGTARRSSALAALTGALSPDVTYRMYGATMEAGLDAEKGEQVWQRRKNLKISGGTLSDPLLSLREGIFVLRNGAAKSPDFYSLLQSPLKVQGEGPIWVTKGPEGLTLSWKCARKGPGSFEMHSPGLMTLTPALNIRSVSTLRDSGVITVSYVSKAPGTCSVVIQPIPELATLPEVAEIPTYSSE